MIKTFTAIKWQHVDINCRVSLGEKRMERRGSRIWRVTCWICLCFSSFKDRFRRQPEFVRKNINSMHNIVVFFHQCKLTFRVCCCPQRSKRQKAQKELDLGETWEICILTTVVIRNSKASFFSLPFSEMKKKASFILCVKSLRNDCLLWWRFQYH